MDENKTGIVGSPGEGLREKALEALALATEGDPAAYDVDFVPFARGVVALSDALWNTRAYVLAGDLKAAEEEVDDALAVVPAEEGAPDA